MISDPIKYMMIVFIVHGQKGREKNGFITIVIEEDRSVA
jgi:hypothetical protein